MLSDEDKRKRHVGTVKFFDDQRGYGFLRTPIDCPVRRDVFVHHTAIQMDGYRTIEAEQTVEFEVDEEEKGPIARKVVVL